MKKTSLTRALFVAGVMAVAGGMAQADAIFYPDGTHVELGENAVENGLSDRVLAESRWTAPSSSQLASLGVSADQSSSMIASSDDFSVDTTTLGAGPAMSTTVVTTTTPVYVFPNINWDRSTVLSQPHPMMSHLRSMPEDRFDRTASATFDSPTRAGEASTMTSGVPNLVTDNPSIASVPPSLPDTTTLGAGPSTMGSDINCGTPHGCSYLPD